MQPLMCALFLEPRGISQPASKGNEAGDLGKVGRGAFPVYGKCDFRGE